MFYFKYTSIIIYLCVVKKLTMEKFSERVNRMSYSQTFVMSNKARDLKAQGFDVISLTLGEPDFDVPEDIKRAAHEAIDKNLSHYSPVPGYLELRQAVCEKLKRDNNLEYKPNQICVSTGGKQALNNVLMAIINEGDEVVLPAPFWVSYEEIVKLVNGVPVVIETSVDSDFKITPAQLEKAITPKTKAFMFSSPCNPSGSYYTKAELEALKDVFVKHPQVVVISDEIYEHINYDGEHFSMAQFSEMFEQTVVVNGMSKAFAMTGWRVGYTAAPNWLAGAIEKIQGQVTSGTNTLAQYASIVGLKADPKKYRYMVEAFQKRRDLVYNLMKEIPGFKVNYPKAAFYIFPDISSYFGKTLDGVEINNSDDFAMFLLEKIYVGTVGGVSFGSPECIRFSYAASDAELIEAMRRIKELMEKYK